MSQIFGYTLYKCTENNYWFDKNKTTIPSNSVKTKQNKHVYYLLHVFIIEVFNVYCVFSRVSFGFRDVVDVWVSNFMYFAGKLFPSRILPWLFCWGKGWKDFISILNIRLVVGGYKWHMELWEVSKINKIFQIPGSPGSPLLLWLVSWKDPTEKWMHGFCKF